MIWLKLPKYRIFRDPIIFELQNNKISFNENEIDNFDIKALMKKYKNTINTGHL